MGLPRSMSVAYACFRLHLRLQWPSAVARLRLCRRDGRYHGKVNVVATVERRAFGALLKRYRLAAGLTHEGLAERARLSARTISDLERGVSQGPRRTTLALLVEALQLPSAQRTALEAAARLGGSASAGYPDLARIPGNLPAQLTSFVGREREVRKVRSLLCREDIRLVTLTGPGGIGKTRLAIRVAAEPLDPFPDGVVYVALAALAD